MKIPERRKVFVFVAILAITPIVTIMGSLIVGDLHALMNPCMSWGQTNGGTITASSAGPCSSASATSDTMAGFLLKMILVPGGILSGALLGVVGMIGKSQALLKSSFVILTLESPLLGFDGLFVLTLPPAVFFMWRAKEMGRIPEAGHRALDGVRHSIILLPHRSRNSTHRRSTGRRTACAPHSICVSGASTVCRISSSEASTSEAGP